MNRGIEADPEGAGPRGAGRRPGVVARVPTTERDDGAFLRERDDAVAVLRQLIAGLRVGRGGTVVITGAAGVGRSALLREARRTATSLDVVEARGHVEESAVPHGLVRAAFAAGCCDPLAPAAPESDAAEVALRQRWRALVERRAATGPVLVLIDDLHLADPGSTRLLVSLARHLHDVPLGLVLTTRPRPEPTAGPLGRLVADGAATLVELAPLGRSSSSALVADLLGQEADDETDERVWRRARGHPLYIEHLVGSPRPDRPDRLGASLGTLPPPVLDQARAAAVLGVEFRPVLLAALTGVPGPAVASAVDVLVAHGLAVESGPGRLAFTAPLVRDALYDRLSPALRSLHHERALRVLASLGEHAAAVRHALAAGLAGDVEAVATATAAGEADLAAGDVGGAFAHFRAAVDLAGARVDAPTLLRCAEAALALGRPAQAADVAAAALARPGLTGEPRLRVRRLQVRALALAGDLAAAERAATAAVTDARVEAPAALAGAVVEMLHPTWQMLGPGPTLARLREIDVPGPWPADLVALDCLAAHLAELDPDAVDRLLVRVLPDAVPPDEPPDGSDAAVDRFSPFDPELCLVAIARMTDRHETADRVLDRAVGVAESGGRLHARLALQLSIVDASLRRGRLTDARRVLDELVRPAEAVPLLAESVAVAEAVLLIVMGDVERAEGVVAATTAVTWQSELWLAFLRARLASARGDVEQAAAAYLATEQLADRYGVTDPACVPWAPPAVAAHLAAEALDDALRVRDALTRRAARSTAPWVRMVTAASRAAVAAATGDDDAAAGAFAEALTIDVVQIVDRAQVLLDHGRWRRHRGELRPAREALAEALALAEAAGARPLARAAADELRVAGGRRRRRGATAVLTPQQERIRALAAAGLTTREMATTLYLSPKTVESHLTRVYQVLGVRSKRALARAVPVDEHGSDPHG
ncbi:helix-turn-helix transcriptional regulator [Actinomycetospora cinnamomea]|nr:LuxR family transcriptional regulator [Actinomycetospora cinnamomea]